MRPASIKAQIPTGSIPVPERPVFRPAPTAKELKALGGMKILMFDIETTPNLVYTWGLFDQNIGLEQIVEPGGVLCWAAKFYGAKYDQVHTGATWKGGKLSMLQGIHRLLDEADAYVTQNGDAFDFKHLNWEFAKAGMGPPSYGTSIDLLKASRASFKMTSRKLDFVTSELGMGHKLKHEGFSLWTKVMNGDPDAQRRMTDYNVQDVLLLEPLYRTLRPWIRKHPNLATFRESPDACPKCGEDALELKGTVLLQTTIRAKYQCTACGSWSKGASTKSAGVKVPV